MAAGAGLAAAFFAAGAACVVKNEVSTSKIVHKNDGKCARCGDAKAPAAAASTRLRLCGRLGFGGSRLRGRGCARRRGVMNAQFAHQAREQCAGGAQPSTARAFATLAGLGATAFAAGAFFAAAFAGVAFLAGVFAMAARAGVASATLAFAPAGAARAARGAPGERKSDANGVGRRAGWRHRPQRHDDSTSAASSRSATRSALRDPRRGAQYVQEVRINACAAPRRVAACTGSLSSLPQRGVQAAPEAYRLTRHAQVHRPRGGYRAKPGQVVRAARHQRRVRMPPPFAARAPALGRLRPRSHDSATMWALRSLCAAASSALKRPVLSPPCLRSEAWRAVSEAGGQRRAG